MIAESLLALLAVLGCSLSAPTTYDQRQEGDLNVKVDLDNFIVLVARPVSASDILAPVSQLFELKHGSSAILARDAAKDQESGPKSVSQEELESKDPKEGSLDDVSLSKAEKPKDEMIVVVQQGEKAARSLETIVRKLRNLRTKEVTYEKEMSRGIGKYKFVDSVDEPQSLKLIGDAIENCGPGRSRDRLGICQSDGLAEE